MKSNKVKECPSFEIAERGSENKNYKVKIYSTVDYDGDSNKLVQHFVIHISYKRYFAVLRKLFGDFRYICTVNTIVDFDRDKLFKYIRISESINEEFEAVFEQDKLIWIIQDHCQNFIQHYEENEE